MARPDLSYLKNLLLCIAGLFCGMLTGLTVAAGSVAATPLVRYLLGLRPGRAGATALATTFCAALGAMLSYHQRHAVAPGIGAALAVTQIIGVAWAERRATALRTIPALRVMWTLLAIAGGLAMIRYGEAIAHMSRMHTVPAAHSAPERFLWLIFVGLIIGALSQVMELGGVLVVPGCMLLLMLDPLTAQGSALFGLLLVCGSGILIYSQSAEWERQSAVWMSFGGLLGGMVGAYYATHLTPPALVSIFGAALAVIGVARFFAVTARTPTGGRPDATNKDP